MPLFLMMFLALGAIFIGISIPLIKRKVPPNGWYGFRVRRTLDDPNVWYPVNAYAAWRLLWVGVATMIVAITAFFLPNLELAVYTSIVAVAAVIGLAITFVQTIIYIGKLPTDDTKQIICGDDVWQH